jgi:hypothetical protein
MDIIDLARASGMTVILDGRIGFEQYQSVCGSLPALQRFADAIWHVARQRHAGRRVASKTTSCSSRITRGQFAVQPGGGAPGGR